MKISDLFNKKPEPDIIAAGKRWHKVNGAKKWEPQVGEVLVGIYQGSSERNGQHGTYRAIVIKVGDNAFRVTGVKIVELVEDSGIQPGDDVCIVYGGTQLTNSGYNVKLFELYTLKDRVGQNATQLSHKAATVGS